MLGSGLKHVIVGDVSHEHFEEFEKRLSDQDLKAEGHPSLPIMSLTLRKGCNF